MACASAYYECPRLASLHGPSIPPPLACLQGKTNFFERRVGEYQRAGVMQSLVREKEAYVFTTEEDF